MGKMDALISQTKKEKGLGVFFPCFPMHGATGRRQMCVAMTWTGL